MEISPAQTLSPDKPTVSIGPEMAAPDIEALMAKLRSVRMDIVSYQPETLPGDEAAARKLFEFAARIKAKNIIGAPEPGSLPMFDRLSGEYNLRIAIPNGGAQSAPFSDPDTALAALKGSSERIGLCADVAAWKRAGFAPYDCLKKAQARLLEVCLSDVDGQDRDTVLGLGKIDSLRLLRELKEQSFKGAVSIGFGGGGDAADTRRVENWAASLNVFSGLVTEVASGSPSSSIGLSDVDIMAATKDAARKFGDAPDTPLPIAADLPGDLTANAVQKAVRKVADWQLGRSEKDFGQTWTFGVLYTGLLAASKTTGDQKYAEAISALGNRLKWGIARPSSSADNQCLGQSYMDLYLDRHDPAMLAGIKSALDRQIGTAPNPQRRQPWWWCDALFMAPGLWARVYKATGDRQYLEYMSREWRACSDALYDPQEHLYYRDKSFLMAKEANGKPVFWSRGNGWVMAGFARTLPFVPADFPGREKFVDQFREMAVEVARLQGADGLWRAGLLDPASYSLPEVSGSALFVYAIAWGINDGILDRAAYEPVVARGWRGLLAHVYADGRLGCIQQTGSAPAHFKPTASYVYGVGAFLLAGSEVNRLAVPAKPQFAAEAK